MFLLIQTVNYMRLVIRRIQDAFRRFIIQILILTRI